MPVFDTTHNERKIVESINEYVGNPIPFLQRFKRGGIGSRRMVIEDLSPALHHYVNARHYLTYSNIEFRPKGIMVHIHKTLDNFAWCLRFEQIALWVIGDDVRLEAEEQFIVFRDGYTFNQKFFDRLEESCEAWRGDRGGDFF